MRTVIIVLLVAVLVFVTATVIFRADDQQKKLIAERDRLIAGHELTTQGLQAELAKIRGAYQSKISDITVLEGQLSGVALQLREAMNRPEIPDNSIPLLWSIDPPSFVADLEAYITLNHASRQAVAEMETKYQQIIAAKDAEISDLVAISDRQARVKLPRFCLILGVGAGYDPFQSRVHAGVQITWGIRIK